MPTAWELYSRPDPLEDEPEPHSWDAEIARLARTYGEGPAPFQDEGPRLQIKRRPPPVDLIARWHCPHCDKTKELIVNIRAGYGENWWPSFYGRPRVLYCKCRRYTTRLDYQGFVRRKG